MGKGRFGLISFMAMTIGLWAVLYGPSYTLAADLPVPLTKPQHIIKASASGAQDNSSEKEDAAEGDEAFNEAADSEHPSGDGKDSGGDGDGKSESMSGDKIADQAARDVPENKAPAITPPKKPYDRPYVGNMQNYVTGEDDTFIKIARKNDLGFVGLRAANPYVDPWVPGKGTELILPSRHLLPDAPHEGIVINLPEMRLFSYIDPYKAPVTHPIGIGREGLATPTGKTKVVRKVDGPTWRPTPRMREEDPSLPAVVPPGPQNPMGTNALYLGWPTYAMHGTNKPYGIGRRVSSGCIRLYPEDIKAFYSQVPVGTDVTVVNQPVKAAWIDDKLYIEAHLTMDQADAMEEDGGMPSYDVSMDDLDVIIKTAGKYANDLDWREIREIIRRRAGYPVEVFEKPQSEKIAAQIDADKSAKAEKNAENPSAAKKSENADDKGTVEKSDSQSDKEQKEIIAPKARYNG